jgi:serine protease Do
VADDFIRVRLVRIQGVDLNLFDFDFDLTWVAFFMNANEKVYGRYGGRDASSAESRLSLAGLNYAMKLALKTHQREAEVKPEPRPSKPLLVDDYPAAKRRIHNDCIHCHQVWEFRRDESKAKGEWSKDKVWIYPLPENVGITLEVDRTDRVKSVKPGSAAEKAGIKAGDALRSLNGMPAVTFLDAQFALNGAPAKGQIPFGWERDGKPMAGMLELAEGWRKTNITWRPSMLDILPSLSLYGDDLTVTEKQALGLPEKRLAFRQDKTVHRDAEAAGVEPSDVIVGIDNLSLEMTMLEFLGYVRKNYLVGDKITLNVLRNGKKVDLPITLK